MCNPRLHHKGLCHCEEKEQLNKLMREWGIEERSDGFYIKLYYQVYFREYGPFLSAMRAIQYRQIVEGVDFEEADKYLKEVLSGAIVTPPHLFEHKENSMSNNKGLIENPIVVRCITPEVIKDESMRALESMEFKNVQGALDALNTYYKIHLSRMDDEFVIIQMQELGVASIKHDMEYIPYD